jgi:hypothetical protein
MTKQEFKSRVLSEASRRDVRYLYDIELASARLKLLNF